MMFLQSHDDTFVTARLNTKRPMIAQMDALEASKMTEETTVATKIDVIVEEQRAAREAIAVTEPTLVDFASTEQGPVQEMIETLEGPIAVSTTVGESRINEVNPRANIAMA